MSSLPDIFSIGIGMGTTAQLYDPHKIARNKSCRQMLYVDFGAQGLRR
jgi:hypothetical protein